MGTKEFKLMKASAFTQKVDEARSELEIFNQNAIAQAVNDAAPIAAQAAVGAVEDELLEIKNDTKEYRDQSEAAKSESLSYSEAAEDSANAAADSESAAQAAYNAIINSGTLQSASIYETIADGLADVEDGEYFWVYPNNLNSIDNLTLFKRVDATTEELLYVQYNLNAFMIDEGANWEIGQ